MDMFNFFIQLNPILQALIAGIFTWLVTAFGAFFVFLIRKINQKVLDGMLGFSAGIMIAASFWSLLSPAIAMSKNCIFGAWFPPAIGFLVGAIFFKLTDKVLPHIHLGYSKEEAEGVKTSWRYTTLLITAITLHNIPEGLAIGVAFGAAAKGFSNTSLSGAIALAIGIGIQNLPEGFAVSVPLRREGISRIKSFWYGQLSGIVEPVAAIIGAAAVIYGRMILPYALAFAAGAMIFVVIEEVIPESQRNGHTDLATTGAIFGFLLMMILDVVLS
ncbi:MAG: ZIP family metal transporter [Candidatus Omnitrophica bacterium]|nr:ZIP family metal transporter [Candidatus Omnitrophota bacterium]